MNNIGAMNNEKFMVYENQQHWGIQDVHRDANKHEDRWYMGALVITSVVTTFAFLRDSTVLS
jgi:hypothetical protein